MPEIAYLSHRIGTSGIAPTPSSSKGILASKEPVTKFDNRPFLGFVLYYCEFTPRYSEAALPLTELTRDDAPASHPNGLPDPAAAAFRKIRDFWANPAHLAPFDDSAPMELYTDASTQAWGTRSSSDDARSPSF